MKRLVLSLLLAVAVALGGLVFAPADTTQADVPPYVYQPLWEGTNYITYEGASKATTDIDWPTWIRAIWYYDNYQKKWLCYLPWAPPYASDLGALLHYKPYVITCDLPDDLQLVDGCWRQVENGVWGYPDYPHVWPYQHFFFLEYGECLT